MAQRRSLTEGIKSAKPVSREEEEFVYGKNDNAADAKPPQTSQPSYREEPAPGMNRTGRVLLSARVLPELATLLKRVSLERQLAGREPHSQQDIVEIALTEWFKKHGHL